MNDRQIITDVVRNSEVAESYLDVWGREKHIDPTTREALVRALGPMRKPARLKLEAGRGYEPQLLPQRGRVGGFMVQLYGGRAKGYRGLGVFGALLRVIAVAPPPRSACGRGQ